MVHMDVLCHVFKIAINEKKNSEFVDNPWSQFPKEITDSTLFLSPRGGEGYQMCRH